MARAAIMGIPGSKFPSNPDTGDRRYDNPGFSQWREGRQHDDPGLNDV